MDQQLEYNSNEDRDTVISLAAALKGSAAVESTSPSSSAAGASASVKREDNEYSHTLQHVVHHYTWQDILKAILRTDGAILPLSIYLFLLDGIAVLLTGSSNRDRDEALEGDQYGNLSSPDELARMHAYLTEMYLRPSHERSVGNNDHRETPSSPFAIGTDTLSTLQPEHFPVAPVERRTPYYTSEDAKSFMNAIRESCLEALNWLQEWLDNNTAVVQAALNPAAKIAGGSSSSSDTGPGRVEPARDRSLRDEDQAGESGTHDKGASRLDEILLHNNTNIPAPNRLLQATLTRAAPESRSSTPNPGMTRTARKASLRLSFSTGTQRWILSSLLQHYLGSGFGQARGTDGVTTYARDERDDQAIRACFPDMHSEAVLLEYESPLVSPGSINTPNSASARPDSAAIDSSAVAAAAAAAAVKDRLDGVKRDDKLKWLFGEAVHTHTVGRSAPLTDPKLARWNSLTHRRSGAPLVARSPIAYHPRRRPMPLEEGWPSMTDAQEVVSMDRRASWASGSPLSPPHRRAWSADSDYSTLRRFESDFSALSPHGQQQRPAKTASSDDSHSLLSYETNSPHEWQGGAPLNRVESTETFDSHSHLLDGAGAWVTRGISVRKIGNHALTGKISLATVEDQSPGTSPSHLNIARGTFGGPSGPFSPRPFANLYPARPSLDSVQSEPSVPAEILPPTTNMLSTEQKQSRIRKNRKLRAMLGSELDDEKLDAIARSSVDLLVSASARHPEHSSIMYGVQVQQDEELRSELFDKPKTLEFEDDDRHADNHSNSSHSIDMSRSSSAAAGSELSSTESFTSPDMARSKPLAFLDVGKHIRLPMSPTADSLDSDGGSPISPVTIMRRPSLTPEEAAREARRRKLMKVQAFLGERVPPSALSTGDLKAEQLSGRLDRSISSRKSIPLITKASTGIQRRLTKSRKPLVPEAGTGALSDDNRHSSGRSRYLQSNVMAPAGRSKSWNPSLSSISPREGAPNVDWDYIEVDPRHKIARDPSDREHFESHDVGKSAEPAILAVRRARKLERVFGSLPPTQLYVRPKKKFQARFDRMMPDNASLRSRNSRCSLYRERIASLKFIAESGDAQLVRDFAKVVLSEESDISEAEGSHPQSKPTGASSEHSGKAIGYEQEHTPEVLHTASGSSQAARVLNFETRVKVAPYGGSRESEEAETNNGRPSITSTTEDLRARLYGTSPTSTSVLHEHLRQQIRSTGQRRGRESVLSGETVQSSTGSAYAVDRFGDPMRSASRASCSTSIEAGTPRSSMESVRIQFQRAHKLARVFGMTRGEIFNRVLDDIEADIAEADEEELDEEEKNEIRESVAALRQAL